MTAKQMVEWVSTHVKLEGGESALDAACWFAAMQDAEAYLDGIRRKDVARMIIDGASLGGPLKTEAELDTWLKDRQEAYTDDGVTEAQLDADLTETMTKFFKRD